MPMDSKVVCLTNDRGQTNDRGPCHKSNKMPKSFEVTDLSPILQQDAHCVYCHTNVMLRDHVVVCDRCHSPHHADCWQANLGRCATFGCEQGTGKSVASAPAGTNTTAHRRSSSRSNRTSRADSDSSGRRLPWGGVVLVFLMFLSWFSSNGPSQDMHDYVVVPTATLSSLSGTLVTGVIRVRHADGAVRPLANTVIGLGSTADSVDKPIQLYRDETSEHGLFAIYGVASGTYKVILDPDGMHLPLHEPDSSGELFVRVRSAQNTGLGALEYDLLSFPEFTQEAIGAMSAPDQSIQDPVSEPRPSPTAVVQPQPTSALVPPQPTEIIACEPPALSILVESEAGADLSDEATKNQASITISNSGDDVLENINVSHNLAPDCDGTISSMAGGESYQYACIWPSTSAEALLEVRVIVGGNSCLVTESLRINFD